MYCLDVFTPKSLVTQMSTNTHTYMYTYAHISPSVVRCREPVAETHQKSIACNRLAETVTAQEIENE